MGVDGARRTIIPFRGRRSPAHTCAMGDEPRFLLTQVLALFGLIAATIEYCEIVVRRSAHRALLSRLAAEEERAIEEAGLRGLVRVLLAER